MGFPERVLPPDGRVCGQDLRHPSDDHQPEKGWAHDSRPHAILWSVAALHELLARSNESIPLDVAALQLASIEFPGLTAEPSLQVLDQYAAQMAGRVPTQAEGAEFIAQMNRFLFEDLGFHGNEADYYNPQNSCLNQVLHQRTGIPISLAVLYIELARRLGRSLFGIGLPGHFLVLYDDGRYATFIDPFHQGRLLTREDCYELAQSVAGVDVRARPAVLQPVTKRSILLRMLNNLRAVYLRQQSYDKAVMVLDLLIQALPGNADEHKQRGLLLLESGRYRDAYRDLSRYLQLQPQAEDRAGIEQQMKRIQRWLATLN